MAVQDMYKFILSKLFLSFSLSQAASTPSQFMFCLSLITTHFLPLVSSWNIRKLLQIFIPYCHHVY